MIRGNETLLDKKVNRRQALKIIGGAIAAVAAPSGVLGAGKAIAQTFDDKSTDSLAKDFYTMQNNPTSADLIDIAVRRIGEYARENPGKEALENGVAVGVMKPSDTLIKKDDSVASEIAYAKAFVKDGVTHVETMIGNDSASSEFHITNAAIRLKDSDGVYYAEKNSLMETPENGPWFKVSDKDTGTVCDVDPMRFWDLFACKGVKLDNGDKQSAAEDAFESLADDAKNSEAYFDNAYDMLADGSSLQAVIKNGMPVYAKCEINGEAAEKGKREVDVAKNIYEGMNLLISHGSIKPNLADAAGTEKHLSGYNLDNAVTSLRMVDAATGIGESMVSGVVNAKESSAAAIQRRKANLVPTSHNSRGSH
jgi:hypothetical protein